MHAAIIPNLHHQHQRQGDLMPCQLSGCSLHTQPRLWQLAPTPWQCLKIRPKQKIRRQANLKKIIEIRSKCI
jgi:hypothetical protein